MGKFELGMSYFEVKYLLKAKYEKEQRIGLYILWTHDLGFFFNNDSHDLKQIVVRNNFDGLFKEKFGLGSSLDEIQSVLGKIYRTEDVYELKEIPGICFELGSVSSDQEWHEMKAPIEVICVYKP